jgi:hypothetical protein
MVEPDDCRDEVVRLVVPVRLIGLGEGDGEGSPELPEAPFLPIPLVPG